MLSVMAAGGVAHTRGSLSLVVMDCCSEGVGFECCHLGPGSVLTSQEVTVAAVIA